MHYLDARGPEGLRIYAIGDIHGRFDLLLQLHERIKAEIARDRVPDWRIILVGDYCDRGPDAKATIGFLAREKRRDARLVPLLGNHDDGFLRFLEQPVHEGVFCQHGGAETARSYGIALDARSSGSLRLSRDALLRAVPADHVAFLGALAASVEFGDFFFCHAGIRPGIPLDRQAQDDLIWIRSEFLHYARLHPKVIIHGHTPCREAEVRQNRVNVDTGAVWTGILTALVIDGAEKRLINVCGAPLAWR